MKAYQHITDRIIRAIETEGLLPWKKPWRTKAASSAQAAVDYILAPTVAGSVA